MANMEHPSLTNDRDGIDDCVSDINLMLDLPIFQQNLHNKDLKSVEMYKLLDIMTESSADEYVIKNELMALGFDDVVNEVNKKEKKSIDCNVIYLHKDKHLAIRFSQGCNVMFGDHHYFDFKLISAETLAGDESESFKNLFNHLRVETFPIFIIYNKDFIQETKINYKLLFLMHFLNLSSNWCKKNCIRKRLFIPIYSEPLGKHRDNDYLFKYIKGVFLFDHNCWTHYINLYKTLAQFI